MIFIEFKLSFSYLSLCKRNVGYCNWVHFNINHRAIIKQVVIYVATWATFKPNPEKLKKVSPLPPQINFLAPFPPKKTTKTKQKEQKVKTKYKENLIFKTPLRETEKLDASALSNLHYLLPVQGSSFSIHLTFSRTVSWFTFGTLPLNMQYLCDKQGAISWHWSPSTSHPNLYREEENFPRGLNYLKDVPLPTFLAYLQPV